MNTLQLTHGELALFAAIPDAVREGWDAQPETLPVVDEPPRKLIRLQLLTLRDPSLQALQRSLSAMDDPEKAALALADVDFHAVSYDDLAELCFAMGPASLTTIITHLLRQAASDEDLASIASLTFLRHELLTASRP